MLQISEGFCYLYLPYTKLYWTFSLVVVYQAAVAVDHVNQDLYMIDLRSSSNHLLGIYNLTNNAWQTKKLKMSFKGSQPASYLIQSDINNNNDNIPFQFHLFAGSFSDSHHLIYNKTLNDFVQISKNGIQNNISYCAGFKSMVYIKNKKILMLLAGYINKKYVDDIYYTKITDKIDTDYKWKKFPIKTPFKRISSCGLLLDDNIIIMVDYEYSSANSNTP